jgi:hypothetical protein
LSVTLQPRHKVGIDIFAVAQGILSAGPFKSKPNFDTPPPRRVIHKHRQLNTVNAQPVIAQINHLRISALATPRLRLRGNANAKGRDVAAARAG